MSIPSSTELTLKSLSEMNPSSQHISPPGYPPVGNLSVKDGALPVSSYNKGWLFPGAMSTPGELKQEEYKVTSIASNFHKLCRDVNKRQKGLPETLTRSYRNVRQQVSQRHLGWRLTDYLLKDARAKDFNDSLIGPLSEIDTGYKNAQQEINYLEGISTRLAGLQLSPRACDSVTDTFYRVTRGESSLAEFDRTREQLIERYSSQAVAKYLQGLGREVRKRTQPYEWPECVTPPSDLNVSLLMADYFHLRDTFGRLFPREGEPKMEVPNPEALIFFMQDFMTTAATIGKHVVAELKARELKAPDADSPSAKTCYLALARLCLIEAWELIYNLERDTVGVNKEMFCRYVQELQFTTAQEMFDIWGSDAKRPMLTWPVMYESYCEELDRVSERRVPLPEAISHLFPTVGNP